MRYAYRMKTRSAVVVQPIAVVQPALAGWDSLSSGSPVAVGFTYLPQVSPRVIQGLIRRSGSFRGNGLNFAGPARRVQPMNNHGCNPWKRTTNGAQDPPSGSNHESLGGLPTDSVQPNAVVQPMVADLFDRRDLIMQDPLVGSNL